MKIKFKKNKKIGFDEFIYNYPINKNANFINALKFITKTIDDYKLEVSSDVHERDGIGIRLIRNDIEQFEIFRDDTNKERYITFYVSDVPEIYLNQAIDRFKTELWNFIKYDNG